MIEKHSAAKHSVSPREKISTAEATVTPASGEGPVQLAAPNAPPAPYALGRAITITIYTAAGHPPIYYLTDGTFYHYNSSEVGILNQLRNQLHPPYPTLGPSLPWG